MKAVFAYDQKIKKIAGEYYYGHGFTRDVFNRYLEHVDELNVICRVISGSDEDRKWDVIDDNISICEISSLGRLFINFSLLKKVERLIKDNDFAICRLPSIIGMLCISVCKKNNIPYVIELVGCPWDSLTNYKFKYKLAAPIMYFLTKSAVKNSPNVLYVSNEFLQKRYPNKYNNINCSDVELSEVSHEVLDKRIEKLKKYKDKKEIVLGTIGAVGLNYKGQQFVIKAIPRLLKLGYRVRYEIVGDGNNTKLKKLAEKCGVDEYVKFLGVVNHRDVFSWLDNIDIYIQPSLMEGLARSLIEAMSRGCPCIASTAGGNAELLDNKYIFKKGDIDGIVDKVIDLINSDLKGVAKVNFNKSKEYDRTVLDKKRFDFFNSIINCNMKQGTMNYSN